MTGFFGSILFFLFTVFISLDYIEELDDYSSWYKRIENNGWRPVCDRVCVHLTQWAKSP